MKLREATIDDARLLYDWRNDRQTRMASHSTAEVPFESHVAWLRATLANPKRRLMVGEEEGAAVGTVRADDDADGGAELSWTVAPQARGRGVARRMVQAAVDQLLPFQHVRAEIKEGNSASISVAEGVGMTLAHQDGEVLHYFRSQAGRS